MNIILKNSLHRFPAIMSARTFSCSTVVFMKEWRVSKGLPVNKNAEGVLTDGPDYTFLDGRPTPLLHKQKQRMLKQQAYAAKMVELISELQFAKDRKVSIEQEKVEERQRIISGRLKPKGNEMLKKKKFCIT